MRVELVARDYDEGGASWIMMRVKLVARDYDEGGASCQEVELV